MVWLVLAFLLGYALLLPCTVRILVQYHEQIQTRIHLSMAGIHKTWTFTGFPTPASPLRSQYLRVLLHAIRSASGIRRYFVQHTHLKQFQATIFLHTSDAARTAIFTGLIRNLLTAFPAAQTKICLLPDFFHPRTSIQCRCIIQWKLGTLLFTTMMLLAATLFTPQQKESEAT